MRYTAMRLVACCVAVVFAPAVLATLPPPSEEQKAAAAETAAKTAWSDKVGLFKLCATQDRIAEAYRKAQKVAGKEAAAAVATPSCADPGPYVSPAATVASKSIESSGAHSPPATAVSPPSTSAPAAQTGTKK